MSWREWAMDADVYEDYENDDLLLTCPNCGYTFGVLPEGDWIPCPDCDEIIELDVLPPEPPDYYLDGIW